MICGLLQENEAEGAMHEVIFFLDFDPGETDKRHEVKEIGTGDRVAPSDSCSGTRI